MFQYMKKQYDQEREAQKNKEKLNKDHSQARQSLTPEELQRLEEAKLSLKEKCVANEKQQQQTDTDLDSKTNTASFKTTYSVTFKKTKQPPGVLPKPPKSITVKEKSSILDRYPSQDICRNTDSTEIWTENINSNEERGRQREPNELIIKTTQIPSVRDAILAFEQPAKANSGGGLTQQKKPRRSVRLGNIQSSLSPASSIDSRTSFVDESPLASVRAVELLSPADKDYKSVNLQLPMIAAPSDTLKVRELVLQRRLSGDFGFTLRKGTVNKCAANGSKSRKNVIFAEPGDKNSGCSLMPGDRLVEVDGVNVEKFSRDEIIELIKKAGSSLKLRVEPSNELSELSLRADFDNETGILHRHRLENGFANSSTGSAYRFKQAKSDDQLAMDSEWLTAERIWLVHKGGFALARLLKSDGTSSLPDGKCRIKLEHGAEVLDVDEEDVEKANPPTFDRVEDLTLLRHLNESSILHTLRQRYSSNLIHTNVGPSTLIVINPMHPLSTYTDKVIHMFKECKPENMPPHIYAMARSTLRNLLTTHCDQSIVLMGRSGSGKTTNARHVVNYYAVTAGSAHGVVTVDKLNACFTVLDAVGNSRTIMNTSTSNFTQITSANFDSGGQLTSVSIQAVMLERARLVRRPEGEPTFHIFYQMLAGIDSNLRKELHLENLSEHCLFMTPLQRADDCQVAIKAWSSIDDALITLAVKEHERKAFYSILASIYHLGVAGTIKGQNGNFLFARPTHGQYAAELLGTSTDDLLKVIFGHGLQQQQPHLKNMPLHSCRPSMDGDGSDVLTAVHDLERFAMDLYFEAFQALVTLINRALSSNIRPTGSILVFDFPGFRNPASCDRQTGATLEDLCHNYVHERLQQLYHETVLVSEKQLYTQENIDCDFEVNESPSSVALLIDGQPEHTGQRFNDQLRLVQSKGLLQMMEEEAGSGSTDDSFLENLLADGVQLRKGPTVDSFIINHLQGTNPVRYCVNGWLRTFRDSLASREPVTHVMHKSKKTGIRSLFGNDDADGILEGSSSAVGLRRTGSLRRAFASGGSSLKRRGLSFQLKLQTDMVIELLRKTRMHFVHCFLPQSDAGLSELKMSLTPSTPLNQSFTLEETMLDVPLVRAQLRGAEVLPAVRLYRQGYPEHIPFQEFLRQFEILIPQNERPAQSFLDKKQGVIHLLEKLDCDTASFRLGETQVFLRSGGLVHLNEMRENCVLGWIVGLQAICRGHLGRQKQRKLKLRHLAASCVQRNVRKLMAIREWSWWRVYTKVKPLLDVHRTETELRDSQVELGQVKAKLERAEKERQEYKLAAERLDAKLSEVMRDFQEENSASVQMSDLLENEKSERLRLDRELKEVHAKFTAMQHQHRQTELALTDAQMLLSSVGSGEGDDYDDDDNDDDTEYQKKLGRIRRDADLSKRKLEQQHSEDVERLEATKRQLERRLAEAIAINDEQHQVIMAAKRKCDRLNQEMVDLRLHLEEQLSRNAELEKKQRKFDSELQKVNDALQTERMQHERINREKDEIAAQKYSLEHELKEVKVELETQVGKINFLEKEIQDMSLSDKGDEEVLRLKQLKNRLEDKIREQEEELDEQAGTIQQLDQAKLRLEMAQERVRQQNLKELEDKDQDLDDLRSSMQKKLKMVEVDLEEAHQEKQRINQEKRELERQMQALAEQIPARNNGVESNLRLALKRTKALLRDAQLMLDKQKEGTGSKAVIKQLRNQLEDAEYAAAVAMKAKKVSEMEMQELKQQLNDVSKAKQEVEQRCRQALLENSKLQSRFEENEEEIAEIMKKYRASIQQNAVERVTFQDHSNQLEARMLENEKLKEELSTMQTRLDHIQFSAVDKEVVLRLEAKISDLETRLDLEETTRHRAEAQLTRLKEQMEKENEEKQNMNINRSRSEDATKRLERRLRDVEEELTEAQRRENDANQRKSDLEKKLECIEEDFERSQKDLQLALKRIDDLHAVIEEGMEDGDTDSDLNSIDGEVIDSDSDD